jgi:hypothetical protein
MERRQRRTAGQRTPEHQSKHEGNRDGQTETETEDAIRRAFPTFGKLTAEHGHSGANGKGREENGRPMNGDKVEMRREDAEN